MESYEVIPNDDPRLEGLPKPNDRVIYDDWGWERPGVLIDYIWDGAKIRPRVKEDGEEILSILSVDRLKLEEKS